MTVEANYIYHKNFCGKKILREFECQINEEFKDFM